jgi:cell division protease FtsH
MQQRGRSWLGSNPLIILLILSLIPLFWVFNRDPVATRIPYGEFKQILQAPGVTVRNLRVGRTEIRGDIVTHDTVSGHPLPETERAISFRTARQGMENDLELHTLLDRLSPSYQGDEEESAAKGILSLFVLGLLVVGMLFLALFVMRWVTGGQSPFSVGRSRHRLHARKDNKVTFQDVAGIEESVAELREVVDFLKQPQKYLALGGRIPKGVLLVGPPGTGKTLLAKAVAGEADVPFFSLSGSDFVELYVGVGASRVRDLFREAESRAPCIIFIDELDAVGRRRGENPTNPHEEREQTLNQLLVEMDGFNSSRGVIIMAATNRPDILDRALLRPGRFDRTVVVDQPDINGREAILKVHVRNIKLAPGVELRKIAALTPGSVGADLANLVNEAALLAARNGQTTVTAENLYEAIERGAVGLERKSRIMRPEEKRRIAIHEAGHALTASAYANADPVHKVSIIPRGAGVGGYVLQRPDDDRSLITQTVLETNIRILLGGTLAEELVFGEISTGAANDLEKANTIARRMVTGFGMSRLGRIFLREGEGDGFLPPGLAAFGSRDCSEATAREIDLEVRRLIDAATNEVRELLRRSETILLAVAGRLTEKEVIDGSELRELLESHGFEVLRSPAANPSANGNIPHSSAS